MEQLSWTARFWHWWAAFSLRRPVLVALLGTLALVASAPFAARLYGDLRTDLRELLPQGAPSAVALEELEKRIGGLSSLAVVVRTADLKAGERFVDALAARIRKLPRNMVARVYYKIDEEKAFFDAHGALYADLKDLAQVRDVLRSRIEEAKKAANPLLVQLDAADDATAAQAPEPALEDAIGRVRSAFGRL